MPTLTPEKRKKIEKLVYDTMLALDVTGENAKQYKDRLSGYSDAQFKSWLDMLNTNEDFHFYLSCTPFHNEPTLEQIEAAAKITGTKLHQYVYFRHDGTADKPVRTAHRVPIGLIHVRRLQQLLYKKTSYSTDANMRSQLTGQLSGHDAVGRLADEEAYALKTVGGEATLNELLGPRADNRDKRLGMYHSIERDGYVQYSNLVGDLKNQPTINYMDTLLLAAGLKSDLIDPTEVLRVTTDSV